MEGGGREEYRVGRGRRERKRERREKSGERRGEGWDTWCVRLAEQSRTEQSSQSHPRSSIYLHFHGSVSKAVSFCLFSSAFLVASGIAHPRGAPVFGMTLFRGLRLTTTNSPTLGSVRVQCNVQCAMCNTPGSTSLAASHGRLN